MSYRLTDYNTTADIGLVAENKTLTQLFADTATGLMEIMVNLESIRENRQLSINIRADSLEDLLHLWLSDLIYYKDADNFLVKKCRITLSETDEYTLSAKLTGDTIDPERHTLKTDVKGVTFYRFKIGRKDNLWFAEMVFDL